LSTLDITMVTNAQVVVAKVWALLFLPFPAPIFRFNPSFFLGLHIYSHTS